MFIPKVFDAVVVVVEVEIVLRTVAVEVTGPLELVNTSIIVVVLIIRTGPIAVGVIIGNAIVVVIHRILVHPVANAHRGARPRMDGRGIYIPVSADISGISALRVVYGAL